METFLNKCILIITCRGAQRVSVWSAYNKRPLLTGQESMKGAPPDMYLIPNRIIMPRFEVDWIKTEGEIAPL